ncbi:MAG: hypothetical protein K6F53_00550 [Lachnospiraceae bacterium]|nr:hypothetical protein [Lachnospiraceae bacterium]
MIPVRGYMPHNLSTFSYLAIIIIWAQTVRQRIDDPGVRSRLLIACAFMVLLFFLRMCKYSYFENITVREYLWYGYTLPLTAIPLFMFLASLYIEPVSNDRHLPVVERILIIINIVFVAVVMTNNLHSQVYKITVHPDKEFTHAWFYYVITLWRLALAVGTLYVIFKKCSLTAARKKWYIPAICIAVSLILLTWYLIVGGSPRIAGHKLFQIHEAVCIPFIMAFESIIQIGLIPVNSGFRRLFYHSGINACIYDKDNRPAVVSCSWTGTEGDEDHRVCKELISGGYVTWVEDITVINRLNHQIEEVTEELNNENDLIRQENKVRAERVSFETKNRLYNRIASAVRTKAVRVNDLLNKLREERDDKEFRNGIIYASVLSAYIKRMGNLMILTDAVSALSSKELGMAISESLQYLQLKGIFCNYTEKGECELPSKAVLLAYEMFETAVEDVWLRLHTMWSRLSMMMPSG